MHCAKLLYRQKQQYGSMKTALSNSLEPAYGGLSAGKARKCGGEV
jgi:hypothetical protein